MADLGDEEALAELEAIRDWAREHLQDIASEEAMAIHEGSLLAEDLTLHGADGYVVSVCKAMTSTSLDQLGSATSLIVDTLQVSSGGTATMVRGAIESASMALWVLFGKDGRERRERALRVRYDSARNAINFLAKRKGMVDSGGLKGLEDEFKSEQENLLASAAKLQLKPQTVKAKPVRTDIVQVVDRIRQNDYLAMWQLCSGYAHGYSWAPRLYNQPTARVDLGPGSGLHAGHMSFDNALTMVRKGRDAVQDALAVFDAVRLPARTVPPPPR
ncbi:hypothetical protein SCMU_39330 [Sinomonas cyclohexanicum]|uniref:DUF222 domain-containing protein n=1 Tax=Sinomonas cyclohexanicum TaxID=322009 RepID=A0ABM7Q0J4_SINCY|nr:hypothetical protein [Corynebacterium cyclohexanicum]BCT78091.1 hypothetical protein SCMU_39330 [Corynebacterium cyclohexanicum]